MTFPRASQYVPNRMAFGETYFGRVQVYFKI